MAKTERRAWNREQTVLVMNLYCRLPFGQQHSKNPQVVALAEALDRTPGSVAMKLNNFTSLDPDEKKRGVHGLTGTSKLDKAVWEEFHQDWDALSVESESLWEAVVEHRSLPALPSPPPAEGNEIHEVQRLVRVRLTQRFFRNAVLASFNEQCCITGNPIPSLLEAAHILGWAVSPGNRVNPRNGLCMSSLHHAAFDQGLITLDEEYRLIVSKTIREYLPNGALEAEFIAYEGHPIRMPEKFRPEPSHLANHRENKFVG